jgi:serine/threonine-protein kinase
MSPRQTIAHYRITAKIGEGGMGAVYRATDTKLNRDVAIKVLPDSFAADPDRLARFQREAQVLASLNHPNIAAIYGVEERALILELVDGPTLAERIARNPIPLEEALPIARQIAEGMEYAHERNVVHRDLKPANIKVAPEGRVKVLDFGLAKAMAAETAPGDPESSPTLTLRSTQMGLILGTAAYMSPEQAKGKTVDKRADIWAFGVVLAEMLTGRQLYGGETVSETLAAVLLKEPPLDGLPGDTPPGLRRLLQRCLAKDVQQRLRDIGEARIAIDECLANPAAEETEVKTAPSDKRPGVWIGVAVALAVALAVWAPWRSERPASGIVRLTMDLAPAAMLGPMNYNRPLFTSLAISPDGNTVVFSGLASKDATQTQLYKRALDQNGATPMPGTANAYQPFFSPDGQWVGFFAGIPGPGGATSMLKKVPIGGGPPVTICDVPGAGKGVGASWASTDQIVFASSGLMQVPAAGGAPREFPKADPDHAGHYSTPSFLPDGKTLLYTKRKSFDWSEAQIVALRVDTGEEHVLVKGGADARYVPTGHLVYMQSGVLMTVPFDAQKVQLAGQPVALIDGVMQSANMASGVFESGMGQFAVSASGNLVFASGGIAAPSITTIVRKDRRGVETELGTPKGRYFFPHLSPDGQRIAIAKQGDTSRVSDIWVIDSNTGNPTRLTQGSNDSNDFPIWSADGKRILYWSPRLTQVLSIAADGSGKPEIVMTGSKGFVAPVSATQSLVVYMELGNGKFEIWTRPLSGQGEPQRYVESKFNTFNAELSPDGHWMTYVMNDSEDEVWVQAFPAGERHRISTGTGPAWARSGRELFFLSSSGAGRYALMAVDFTPGTVFKIGVPHKLFEANFLATMPQRSYDVMPDGQHFIMTRREEFPDQSVGKLNVVLNWAEELKKRAPRSGR